MGLPQKFADCVFVLINIADCVFVLINSVLLNLLCVWIYSGSSVKCLSTLYSCYGVKCNYMDVSVYEPFHAWTCHATTVLA